MITVDTNLDEVRRETKLKRGRDGRLRPVKCYVCKYYDQPLGQMEILPDPHLFYLSSIGYSEELRDLVRRCMAYYPENSATLRDLDREIEQYLSTHPIQRDNLDLLESRVDNEYALNVPYRGRHYRRRHL
jgi:hypothetical protein